PRIPTGSSSRSSGRCPAGRRWARGPSISTPRSPAGPRGASDQPLTNFQGDGMLALWVKVRIKPGERQRFLKAIDVDALGSQPDEAGCLRFNVLQDAKDENIYYFYEVYKDEAAGQAARTRPAQPVWGGGAARVEGATEANRCPTRLPAVRALRR